MINYFNKSFQDLDFLLSENINIIIKLLMIINKLDNIIMNFEIFSNPI